jgi:UDP-N-acetylmuramyl tripeptide synthase
MIIGGRVTAALCPTALARLTEGRRVVLVTGTNGKTTTSYLVAAALRTMAPVAHNDTGANMADGALAAVMHDRHSPLVVLETDELHLSGIAAATRPEIVVALNLSRDQLDRVREVRGTAAALAAVGAEHEGATMVANSDDPLLVWALVGRPGRTIWLAGGGRWAGDAIGCPGCGALLSRSPDGPRWQCSCGLRRPTPDWAIHQGGLLSPHGFRRLRMRLPGRFNATNALAAVAVAAEMGVDVGRAVSAVEQVTEIGGRYRIVTVGRRRVRLLLAKNPAGWAETIPILGPSSAVVVAINAREADGRDVSWLWDVPFEDLRGRYVAAVGDRAADLGVRLSYACVPHETVLDPLTALAGSPEGDVDVVADYTSFRALIRRLDDLPVSPR